MSETLALAWAWSESSSQVSCSELMSESVDCCDCCLLGVGDRDEKPESELELQDRSDLHATWSRCPLLGGLRNVQNRYFIVKKYYCSEYFISYLQYEYHTNISNEQQWICFLSITNKTKCYTIFFIIFNVLHVSDGFSAHHQELKNCIHSIWYVPSLLAATVSVVGLDPTTLI